MTFSGFLKQYLFITFLCAATIGILSTQHFFDDLRFFSWISLGFFAVVSISTTWFVAGGNSKRKGDVINYFLIAVTGKLLLSILFILIYALAVRPESKLFVVPFFVLYLIYSIMQTRFLSQWGRKKVKDKS